MATYYEICPDEVQDICNSLMSKYREDLTKFGTRILCMFASCEGTSGPKPALKLHGNACAAIVRITSQRDRAAGLADAIIAIDKNVWYNLSEPRQVALIDHELTHLECEDCDDDERPDLKMRKHDWELHGFEDVILRHGPAALEVVDMGSFSDSSTGQRVFDAIESGRPVQVTEEVEEV
jgi:hypothetical protein